MSKIVTTLTFLLLFFPCFSYAQGVQSGEFVLETTEKKVDPYENNQKEVVKYLNNLKSTVSLLSQGKPASIAKPAGHFYKYMNAIYLDCAKKRGICPIFLDSILEIDVINSKKEGKVTCGVSKRYWKSWIANDIEKRIGHNVKTALVNKTKNFNKQERPKYIKCKDTIQKILDESKDIPTKDFFIKRYKDNKDIVKAIAISSKYVETTVKKVPNIYFKVGM